MFQSTIVRLCVLSLTMVIVTAKQRNCGDNPPCPEGQFCAPPGRGINGVKGQWKCFACPCREASQCYFDTTGNIKCECGSDWTGRFCETPLRCGPLPDFGLNVDVSGYHGNDSIGSSFTYTCTPCTWFVDINAASTITCQADGTWSTPTCVFGQDVGYLADGTPVPAGAKGCKSCPGLYVDDGFKMDGSNFGCQCDKVCCGYGDCCYNFNC